MTDQTTDLSSAVPRDIRRSAPLRREFIVYFGIIFLATLPLTTVTWALSALRQMRIPVKGPVARAWSQARIITPMIFLA
jgi:hypothetical protein